GWFQNRSLGDDYAFSVRQVQNLRRSLDVLSQRRDVDRKRIAYLGHDFGATFGAIMLGVDQRVSYAVLMAGTPVLSDWYLLGSKLQGAERDAYVKRMALLDPINFLARTHATLLLQFSANDRFISKDKAELFANSAKEKDLRWYDAQHELNAQAA